MARTHVVMPDELLGEIDRVVGKRGRSRFIREAAAEKLERLGLAGAITSTVGIARGPSYGHWCGRDTAAEWVRSVRDVAASTDTQVTAAALRGFSRRFSDLDDPQLMGRAWS